MTNADPPELSDEWPAWAHDPKLPLKVKGVLAVLHFIGGQEGISAAELIDLSGDGRESVWSALRATRASGYVERVTEGVNGSRHSRVRYRLYDDAKPRPAARLIGKPTVVYRHFDASGHLLYVGMTASRARRERAHARNSPWYELSERRAEMAYPNDEEASQAETSAIDVELPLFNWPPDGQEGERFQRLWEYLAERDRLDLWERHMVGRPTPWKPRFASRDEWLAWRAAGAA